MGGQPALGKPHRAPEAIEIRLNGARPAFLLKVELMAKFFVSMALRANYAPVEVGSVHQVRQRNVSCAGRRIGCCGRGSGREG
jgi:hypothetical protein